ncbi:MAG TPA: DUF3106 domain-containing protein [Methylomirabilota bacterium]|nr:DUF3106 domain-containing protein [Methylomirabilota bacterium]
MMENYQRWQRMTPEQRAQVRERLRRLTPEERQRLRREHQPPPHRGEEPPR